MNALVVVPTYNERENLPVLAAGGIASLDDLAKLRDLGCEGAIVGSALWSGRFTLPEALAYSA